MKVIVVTDTNGKLLGAHRVQHASKKDGPIHFVPVSNEKQKSHEVELDDDFFSRPPAHVRAELNKVLAARH